MMIWLRSVAAVVAGLAAGMVAVMVLTYAAALVFFGGDLTAPPTPVYLVANITYSFGSAVLAGWLAASLAPRWPPAHAVAVAAVMLLLSGGGGGGEASAASGVPDWYGPALTVLMPLGALVGGWLGMRWTAREASPEDV
jgi:hypothetical protein